MLNLKELFDKHNDEFLKYGNIASPEHERADVCAFIMLDRLSPAKTIGQDMVTHATHDEIGLGADMDEVARNATEAQIIDLIRCGVRLDDTDDGFAMFV